MIVKNIKLLPCPFYGSNNVVMESTTASFYDPSQRFYTVHCENCLAQTMSEQAKESGAANWNTRA